VASIDENAFLLAGSLAYLSLCANPFIYASRYEVFRRFVKQMVNNRITAVTGTASHNTAAAAAAAAAPASGVATHAVGNTSSRAVRKSR